MSVDTTKSFRNQLEDICKHLEKCKVARERRHSEFTKRFDEIVARHDRLTSGRLRRLSLEGIIVDIDSVRGHKRVVSSVQRERSCCHSPTLRRAKTDYLEDGSKLSFGANIGHAKIQPKQAITNSGSLSRVDFNPELNHVKDQEPYKQFRLELSFDSKHPNRTHPATPLRFLHTRYWRPRRNKSLLNYLPNQANLRRNKFQRAFDKVIHVQRFTEHRRHTILSMAPIDIGEKSQLPSVMVYDKKDWHGYGNAPNKINKIYQRNESPSFVTDRQPSQESFRSSGKQKFQRALKKLESARKFADLYRYVRKDNI